MPKIRCRSENPPPRLGVVPGGIRGKGRLPPELCRTDRTRRTESNRGHAGADRAGIALQDKRSVFRSGFVGCCPARKRWRGEVTSRQNRLRAPGVGKWSAAGGPQSRGRFGRGGGRFDPRASRRLCRTLGLPESRKSPPKWIVFVRRRSRGPVPPDPAAGFERRSPRRKNLSLAGVEIRSRLAHPIPARVGRCRAKWENRKVAEREGFEPSEPLWGSHAFQACSIGHSDTSPRPTIHRIGTGEGT